MKKILTLVMFVLSMNTHSEEGGNKQPYEILKTGDAAKYAKAKLSDLAWLAGSWQFEATFMNKLMKGNANISEAANGQMLGYSRGWHDKALVFNEILTYTQREDSIDFRAKHFSYDLHGWEPLDQPAIHPLIKVEADIFYFDKHTIVKESNDSYTLYLMVIHQDGKIERYTIPHKRIK